MAERSKKRRRSNDDSSEAAERAEEEEEATVHLRIGAALQKQLAGRTYCTPADLDKPVLIACLLALGELKLVDDVFDVRVETLSGDTFEVTMGSDDNKVLALKRKISKQQGTSMARQDLILVDGAEGEGGKSEDPEEGMAVVDRVALRDDAALAGACSVVLYVKDSGAVVWLSCSLL